MRAKRFEEARRWLEAIFDPTDGDALTSNDVWRFKPFRDAQSAAQLQADIVSPTPSTPMGMWLKKLLGGTATGDIDLQIEQQIAAWESDPFSPHRIARMRPIAYQKAIVRSYVELLVDWGDHLFRRFTIESVNEAQQLYLLAKRILGDRPQRIESPLEPAVRTFADIRDNLDPLNNSLIGLEGALPVMPQLPNQPASGLPTLQTAYFCIPPNDLVSGLWDTVEDRIFKIRHCLDIEGVARSLPLFQPPIDPALLIKAKAAGLDLASALDDLYAPPPLYRFHMLLLCLRAHLMRHNYLSLFLTNS